MEEMGTIDEYPVVWLSLKRIRYRWEHPSQEKMNSVLAQYLGYESVLKSRDGLHRLTVDRAPLAMLYQSIQQEGLINPMIVKGPHDGWYFTVIGNQRLAVLRAIEHHKGSSWVESDREIPCRIAKPTDGWCDNTEVRFVHPYVPMRFDPFEKVWKMVEDEGRV